MLKVFGTPLTKYAGKCELTFNSNYTVKGSFECIQLTNGEIYLYAKVPKHEQKKYWTKFRDPSIRIFAGIEKVEGLLPDGAIFKTEGPIILSRITDFFPIGKKPMRLLLHLSSIQIKYSKSATNPSMIRLHLTNLVFLGNNWHWEEKNRLGYRVTTFNIHRKRFTLYPRHDYQVRVAAMGATRLGNVTSILEVKLGKSHIETILSQVEIICSLFSIAKGTQVNWVYYETCDGKGNLLTAHHVNRITRDYTSLWLLDDKNPSLLKDFVTNAFTRYEELSSTYPMVKLINTVMVAKLDGSFIELRALILATMVDVLCGIWARLNDRVSIMDEEIYSSRLDEFSTSFEQFLEKELGVTKAQSKSMASHARGLNYYTFGSTLRKLVKYFNVQLTEFDIQSFVNSRNQLVHKGEFVTSDKTREFFQVMRFADRLILGMLDFRVDINDPHRRFLK